MNDGDLDSKFFDQSVLWMDTGTFESMKDASEFIAAIQKRQDILVGSPELAAFKNQWLSKKDIEKNLHYSNQYAETLLRLID
jgi:glucose-1-phosphate thymidylyltransferase